MLGITTYFGVETNRDNSEFPILFPLLPRASALLWFAPSEFLLHLLQPFLVSKRTAFTNASRQRGFLGGGLGSVHPSPPVGTVQSGDAFDGDLQRFGELCLSGAAPRPVAAAFCQVGAQRVSFDITAYGGYMRAVLRRETFVTPLVYRAGADQLSLDQRAADMAYGQPEHESREVAVFAGPEHQMPVVGHDAIGEHPHIRCFEGLDK